MVISRQLKNTTGTQKMKKLFIVISLLMPFSVSADFLPTSPFWGVSDGTFIVKRIDGIVAMQDREGNRFELPKRYKAVSDFSDGICTLVVRTNESGTNVLGIITNKAIQKAFYLREENGRLEIADVDFIKFHCKEI